MASQMCLFKQKTKRERKKTSQSTIQIPKPPTLYFRLEYYTYYFIQYSPSFFLYFLSFLNFFSTFGYVLTFSRPPFSTHSRTLIQYLFIIFIIFCLFLINFDPSSSDSAPSFFLPRPSLSLSNPHMNKERSFVR